MLEQVEEQEKRIYGYKGKVGKEVSVHFTDGKALKGKLIRIFKYDFILEVERGDEMVEVTVFKGAVKYII